jgi:hypothetical protein
MFAGVDSRRVAEGKDLEHSTADGREHIRNMNMKGYICLPGNRRRVCGDQVSD